jgi:hypothetical protein
MAIYIVDQVGYNYINMFYVDNISQMTIWPHQLDYWIFHHQKIIIKSYKNLGSNLNFSKISKFWFEF